MENVFPDFYSDKSHANLQDKPVYIKDLKSSFSSVYKKFSFSKTVRIRILEIILMLNLWTHIFGHAKIVSIDNPKFPYKNGIFYSPTIKVVISAMAKLNR